MSINNYVIGTYKKSKNYYKALTVKKKVFIILSMLVVMTSISSFTLLQISFKVYDNELINTSSEILSLYSSNIENELRKMERMTFEVLSSSEMQNYLKVVNDKQSSYERNVMIQNMERYLRLKSDNERYISSISLIDLNGNIYTVGNSTIHIESNTQMEILKRADEAFSFVWMEPKQDDRAFILARKIRDIRNLDVTGTLIVRIDPIELMKLVSSMSPKYKGNLKIISDRNIMIYEDSSISEYKLPSSALTGEASKIYSINNEKFLINNQKSNYTKWTYVYFLSYENVFKNIYVVRVITMVFSMLIFVVAIYMGLGFSDSITKPIITLSKKMKNVQKGNFENVEIARVPYEESDEINQLSNDFVVMIDKINELIKENYVKQISVKETQLKALQAQINPHFLYNTLNSINWIAKANKQDDISNMVKALGNLLRSSISSKDSIITVEDELKLLSDYITIQRIRYEERLDLNIHVDEDLKQHHILKLTLQPIVENSIKYGLEQITGIGKIEIKSLKFEDYFELVVCDNGPGMSDEFLQKLEKGENEYHGTGIGLKNIDERIKLFFGDEYGLSVFSEINKGTTVKMKIPYK
jgi:two-component system, sensor histidine kinase YesM